MVHRFGKGRSAGRGSGAGFPAVLAVAAVALAAALTACASTTQPGSISVSGASVPASAGASSSSGSGGSAASGSASINPGGPMLTPTGPEAKALLATLPKGAKLVPVQSIGRSSDGRTLYLGVEAQGGACGNYTAVSTTSTTSVLVGLAQIPKPAGVMCPMIMHRAAYPVKLSSALGTREVVDLADGHIYSNVPLQSSIPAFPLVAPTKSGQAGGANVAGG
jgi:hypothetical protein